MTLDALKVSRGRTVASELSELKHVIASLVEEDSSIARETTQQAKERIQRLLEREFNETTVAKIRLALVEHSFLIRGLKEPALAEVGLPGVLDKLPSNAIGCLVDAYGDFGSYAASASLDMALQRLLDCALDSRKQRNERSIEEQLAIGEAHGCGVALKSLTAELSTELYRELQIYGIHTAFELSQWSRVALRDLPGITQDHMEAIDSTLLGLGLALQE